jgi:protein-tyrosine phosphatase
VSNNRPSGAPGWRGWIHRHSTRLFGPSALSTPLSWIAEERIAIGRLPTALSLPSLLDEGITHVVNCRARAQTWFAQDLAVEKAIFGRSHVMAAPMWDDGRPQPPARWADAAVFAASALRTDEEAKVLIHCHEGRRRSVLLAYAVLRLRGHDADDAARLITRHRLEAVVVPAYRDSVEQWIRGRAEALIQDRRILAQIAGEYWDALRAGRERAANRLSDVNDTIVDRYQERGELSELLEPLLDSDDVEVRYTAAAYLAKELSSERALSVLEEISQGSHGDVSAHALHLVTTQRDH